MAVSSTLTNKPFDTTPVWEKVITQTWITGDGHAEQSQPVSINGLLQKIVLKVSSVTGDPDVTLTIDDNGDNEIFNSGAKDDGATYTFSLSEPVVGVIDVAVDPSADPGGAAQTLTVITTLRGIR